MNQELWVPVMLWRKKWSTLMTHNFTVYVYIYTSAQEKRAPWSMRAYTCDVKARCLSEISGLTCTGIIAPSAQRLTGPQLFSVCLCLTLDVTASAHKVKWEVETEAGAQLDWTLIHSDGNLTYEIISCQTYEDRSPVLFLSRTPQTIYGWAAQVRYHLPNIN